MCFVFLAIGKPYLKHVEKIFKNSLYTLFVFSNAKISAQSKSRKFKLNSSSYFSVNIFYIYNRCIFYILYSNTRHNILSGNKVFIYMVNCRNRFIGNK